MSAFTAEERIALLLAILGEEVADAAVEQMNPTRANFVKRLVKDYQQNPPTDEEAEFVLHDFVSYFQFALSTKASVEEQHGLEQQEEADSQSEPKKKQAEAITYFPEVEPTSDAVADINNLDPFQISEALVKDHPKTIALVLERLQPAVSAVVLQELPEEVRNETMLFLSQESNVPQLIVDKVLRSTFEKACTVKFRANKIEQTQMVANMLRSVPKKLRGGLLSQLEETDETFYTSVREKLYRFEDIARLGDRDAQRMLGEIQTDFLIVGLQQTDPSIKDKLLGNLSKRARQSVLEEMEFKADATADEIEEAQAEIVAVMARLDESGDINLS